MASYVIEKCVVRQGGYGGFITAGFHRLVNYIIERNLLPVLAYTELRKSYLICISNDLTPPLIALSDGGTASSTAFITITVTHAESPKSGKQPGNTDPAIPLVIGKYMHAAVGGSEGSGQLPKIRSIGGQMWELASTGMIRSSSTTWWLSASQSSTHDEMTYECDTALGSPAVVDCTQVEWNQLGPPSDTVRVGPGMVQFLHSSESKVSVTAISLATDPRTYPDTCFVAISAEIIILLSWSQIRTAVSTIMNMCIQNPLQSSQGGRAYYKSAAKATRRDGGFTQLTGLNALPPHTNITIFQQQEPWTDPTKELSSCTWDAVQNRNPLTKCLTA